MALLSVVLNLPFGRGIMHFSYLMLVVRGGVFAEIQVPRSYITCFTFCISLPNLLYVLASVKKY